MKTSTTSSPRNCLCLPVCVILTRELFFGVYHAAKAGRLLPRLTLMMHFHAIAHWFLFVLSLSTTQSREYCRVCSLYFMATNLVLNVVGYTTLILIYRHSVQTIFNRKIPTIRKDAIQSFNTHLLMLRPLETVYRFVTAPLRVLPDVIVLGETRCGTTNLCGHIVSLSSISSSSGEQQMKIKCYTPFCAWAHPELDHKESFYFVGHYLGKVVSLSFLFDNVYFTNFPQWHNSLFIIVFRVGRHS